MSRDQRIEVPDGKETIRDKVIKHIQDHLGNVTTLFDPDDPEKGPLFDFSKRGTLDDIKPTQTPGCAIEEGDEATELSYYPLVDKTFRIFVNFKVVKGVGVDVFSLLNYYIGRIEQEIVRPNEDGLHIADLTLSVETAGNSIQYNGDSDPEPGGTAMFDIQIRHALGNPFMETANG